jgi:hypothetical protein
VRDQPSPPPATSALMIAAEEHPQAHGRFLANIGVISVWV